MTATSGARIDHTLVNALRARLAKRGREVIVCETHISWVLLAGRLAVKLKKPVRMPFLDFSTPERRREACEEELRLNRRLAPVLYRCVLGVHGTAAAPRLDRRGPVIDTVLCMRRFPEGALFSERLRAGTLSAGQVERLAEHIAGFHERAEILPDAASAVADATGSIERVLSALEEFESEHWRGLSRHWLEFSRQALGTTFGRRRKHGAVRDGHGDLHLANAVAVGDDVTAFDCIEFDAALRRIDVMSDVAFMTMDLAVHGRPDLAHRFLDAYLAVRPDYAGLAVLRFYETARACVRRLVGHLDPGHDPRSSPDYLGFALHGMTASRPRLAILCGPSGAGKSTIAARLADLTGAVRIRSDVERKRLFGLAANAHDAGARGLYDAEATERTYARLADHARTVIEAGFDAIVDASFLQRDARERFMRLAADLGVALTLFAIDAPEAELRRRVAARLVDGIDPSDADENVLASQLRSRDPLRDDERALAIEVDTGHPVDIDALAAQWQARSGPA